MASEVPQARVVRDRLQLVASPPRRIPPGLWLRLVFGGGANQSTYAMLALIAWIFGAAFLGSSKTDDDDSLLALLLGVVFISMCAIVLVGIALMNTRQQLRLLRHGLPVQGTLVNVDRPTEHDERVTTIFTFRYVVGDGVYEVTVSTMGDGKELQDEATETMLYLPSRPAKALPLDYLPGLPRIGENGELVARNRRVWPVLVLPLVALAGIAALYSGA